MRHLRKYLVLVATAVCGTGVLGSPSVEALIQTNARTAGQTSWDANGVRGFVGSFLDSKTGNGSHVSGAYGHQVAGQTCLGSDDQHRTNFLMVQSMWESEDNPNMIVTATATTTQCFWILTATDNNCENGPPSWTPTGTVTVSEPAEGSTGGDPTQVVTTIPVYTSPGGSNSGSLQDPPPTEMAATGWVVDPTDSSTWAFRVTVSIDARLNGGGVEIVVTNDFYSELVALDVVVTGT